MTISFSIPALLRRSKLSPPPRTPMQDVAEVLERLDDLEYVRSAILKHHEFFVHAQSIQGSSEVGAEVARMLKERANTEANILLDAYLVLLDSLREQTKMMSARVREEAAD